MFHKLKHRLRGDARNRVAIAVLICSAVMGIGTTGFVFIEKYSPLEGLYMTAITLSTVGFGEVRPLSTMGRAFTTGLILLCFLALAITGHALGQSLLEGIWSGKAARKKMRKKIGSLKGHYIICGYGRVGASAAANFNSLGHDYVVIESDENQAPTLEEKGTPFLIGDATHENILVDAGIKKAVGVLALLDSDPDNLFVVLTARELNPTLKIISRSGDHSTGKKIMRAGADDVISPLTTAGRQIAHEMLLATGRLSTQQVDSPSSTQTMRWVTISETSAMINRPLGDWQKANNFIAAGIRRNGDDILLPAEDTLILAEDHILILENGGMCRDDPTTKAPSNQKLVIIDDSPVIVRLYSRLFQKAGFTPIVAQDGTTGLHLIQTEKPVAAVIDYHLPEMSGADICRKVRQMPAYDDIKLILFTSDNRLWVQKEAQAAGVDSIVVKSAKADEVINEVLKILQN